MSNTAMIQLLGAVAYGELKAHDGARAEADRSTGEERRRWRKVAAEELRHHKGFVGRLGALGADPERALQPFRPSLDRFHSRPNDKKVEDEANAATDLRAQLDAPGARVRRMRAVGLPPLGLAPLVA